MQHFNKGWDGGAKKLEYGAGLMRLQPSCGCSPNITGKDGCSYRGHGGDTYGFITMYGLRPALTRTTIILMRNDTTEIP
jgi:hypothetical protein